MGKVKIVKKAKGKTKTKTKSKAKATKAKPATERGSHTGKSGVKKAEFWASIFSKNSKAKLTDAQIVGQFNKDFRTTLDEKSVASARSAFNTGRLSGQEKAPKVSCPKFDKKGNVVTRGRPAGTTVTKPKVAKKGKLTLKIKPKLVIKKSA